MPSSTAIYTLSLHAALPICARGRVELTPFAAIVIRVENEAAAIDALKQNRASRRHSVTRRRRERHRIRLDDFGALGLLKPFFEDRKSTRLNSSHLVISYAVFHRYLHSFPTRRSSDLRARSRRAHALCGYCNSCRKRSRGHRRP